MKYFFLGAIGFCLLLMFSPLNAATYFVSDKEGNIFRLLTTPCTQSWLTKFKSAVITFRGRTLDGCWARIDEQYLLLIDADGDVTKIPLTAVQRESET